MYCRTGTADKAAVVAVIGAMRLYVMISILTQAFTCLTLYPGGREEGRRERMLGTHCLHEHALN